MRLLGATLSGKILEIKLSDCPCVIDKGQVACLAKPNSDIFHKDSIVYTEESANVVEGDLVYEDGVYIGIAYYEKGWRIHSDNCQSKELVLSEHISMKESRRTYDVFRQVSQIEGRSGIFVYANGCECSLFEMTMVKGNEIAFVGRNKRACRDEIFLTTGFYSQDSIAYYFGQYINGGILSLNKNLEFVLRSSINEVKINMEEM